MLKQRLITAACMLAIFLLVLFALPWESFVLFVTVVVLIGAWEWANLSGFESRLKRIAYCMFVLLLMLLMGYYTDLSEAIRSGEQLNSGSVKNILIVAGAWWALALLWVQGYPSSAVLWGGSWLRALMGCFVLLPMWLAVIYLDQFPYGPWLILLLMLTVIIADTGAYFFGRAFGKRKLAINVSPGKSWEGFWGGLFSCLVLALCVSLFSNFLPWPILVVVLLITALSSVLGDLLESMVKRHRGIKDSGRILPGHGGVMDRIDSITAAAPIFVLCLFVSGWQV